MKMYKCHEELLEQSHPQSNPARRSQSVVVDSLSGYADVDLDTLSVRVHYKLQLYHHIHINFFHGGFIIQYYIIIHKKHLTIHNLN